MNTNAYFREGLLGLEKPFNYKVSETLNMEGIPFANPVDELSHDYLQSVLNSHFTKYGKHQLQNADLLQMPNTLYLRQGDIFISPWVVTFRESPRLSVVLEDCIFNPRNLYSFYECTQVTTTPGTGVFIVPTLYRFQDRENLV